MSSKYWILAALVLNAGASLVTPPADPLVPLEINAPDGSAKAHIMPFGATTTNFWVKDKNGKFRDIIIGYDNKTLYETQGGYFGPVVGRYANRIRNGTFTIPVSANATGPGKKFQIVENENNGTDTLHGGLIGYDKRPWTLVKHTANSVLFSLTDPNGDQGFPGTVFTMVQYTLESKSTWKISMHATATELTPIMLSCHHFWNLEAYEESEDLSGHWAQFPSSKFIATNGNLIPNGLTTDVTGTAMDFRQPRNFAQGIAETNGTQVCGTGCVGYDNAWVYDKHDASKPVFSMWNTNSGIKLDVTTDQVALQIYSCNGVENPPAARKVDQGGPDKIYLDHSCLVIEQESWIDGINNPQFPVDQIFGPLRPYTWESSYQFSVIH
ncbi:galactose mutarotase-like domain-containing protein [Roridomyces roridus]|uniref:Galactose mutarotase-like domain-containing protein n=1 Tax=Roridomyces roridus TaxID=1738132 RepID=A0AAD7FU05_9AGAR|nr:galactose mutarotase-like domain-containing protein [Roridomyces roridus]